MGLLDYYYMYYYYYYIVVHVEVVVYYDYYYYYYYYYMTSKCDFKSRGRHNICDLWRHGMPTLNPFVNYHINHLTSDGENVVYCGCK